MPFRRTTSSAIPGVDDRDAYSAIIRGVARDQDETVHDRGRGNEPVHITPRPQGGDAPPFDRYGVCDGENAIGMIAA